MSDEEKVKIEAQEELPAAEKPKEELPAAEEPKEEPEAEEKPAKKEKGDSGKESEKGPEEDKK